MPFFACAAAKQKTSAELLLPAPFMKRALLNMLAVAQRHRIPVPFVFSRR